MQFRETEITGWDVGCRERYGAEEIAHALPESRSERQGQECVQTEQRNMQPLLEVEVTLLSIFPQNVGFPEHWFLPLRKVEGNCPASQRQSQACWCYTDTYENGTTVDLLHQ